MTTICVVRPETLLSGLFVREESANVTNGKEVEGVPVTQNSQDLSSRSCHFVRCLAQVLGSFMSCFALGRKQDMKESVDSATATGGDVTATPPALAAVDFDVDRRPGCFCTALHTMRMLVLRRTEKTKKMLKAIKQVSPTT